MRAITGPTRSNVIVSTTANFLPYCFHLSIIETQVNEFVTFAVLSFNENVESFAFETVQEDSAF